MTYEQHVREVALELAGNYWNQNKSNPALRFEQLGSDIQNIQVDKMLSTARIAVRREAESLQDGYVTAVSHINAGHVPDYISTQSRRGFIPVPENNSFHCGGSELSGNDRCTNQCGICSKKQRDGHDTHH